MNQEGSHKESDTVKVLCCQLGVRDQWQKFYVLFGPTFVCKWVISSASWIVDEVKLVGFITIVIALMPHDSLLVEHSNRNVVQTQTKFSDEAEQSDEAEFLDNSDESDDNSNDIFDDASDNE
ncbi:hypothetical protein Tco_0332290 [Tanacetum coccineum]